MKNHIGNVENYKKPDKMEMVKKSEKSKCMKITGNPDIHEKYPRPRMKIAQVANKLHETCLKMYFIRNLKKMKKKSTHVNKI